jgi:hypothetical protein
MKIDPDVLVMRNKS